MSAECRMCGRGHLPEPTLTDEQLDAWESSRLDARCLDCEATAAASAMCFRCGGTRLAYRTHEEQGSAQPWCEAPVAGLDEVLT